MFLHLSRYVHRRLLEISSERQNAGSLQQRQRSFSLPASEFPTSVPTVGLTPCHEAAGDGDGVGRQPAFKRQRVTGDEDQDLSRLVKERSQVK